MLPPGRNKVPGWIKQSGGLDSALGPCVFHMCPSGLDVAGEEGRGLCKDDPHGSGWSNSVYGASWGRLKLKGRMWNQKCFGITFERLLIIQENLEFRGKVCGRNLNLGVISTETI